MACSLRARGADYPTIAATLSAINANRCSPPLEHTEIDGIVKSACRYAPGTASPHVNGEVHAELDTFAVAVYDAEWRGKAGKTDRDVLLALIGYARQYGVPIPTGVRLSVSYRDLAMEATIGSLDTLRKSIHRRLKPAGWLRPDNGDRRARDAEAFVVLSERPHLIHTTSSRAEGRNQARRAPATAPLPVYRSLVSR
jgi:primase-like protein